MSIQFWPGCFRGQCQVQRENGTEHISRKLYIPCLPPLPKSSLDLK